MRRRFFMITYRPGDNLLLFSSHNHNHCARSLSSIPLTYQFMLRIWTSLRWSPPLHSIVLPSWLVVGAAPGSRGTPLAAWTREWWRCRLEHIQLAGLDGGFGVHRQFL